jgi:branched-chain amino acid transport system permease protein
VVALPLASPLSPLAGAVYAISVRTEGIYTIMITLAIGAPTINAAKLRGVQRLQRLSRVLPPTVFDLYWRDPLPYYYLALMSRPMLLLRVLCAARLSASPCGHSRQPARMRASASTSRRTALHVRGKALSPAWAGYCSLGSTVESRPAPSVSAR